MGIYSPINLSKTELDELMDILKAEPSNPTRRDIMNKLSVERKRLEEQAKDRVFTKREVI